MNTLKSFKLLFGITSLILIFSYFVNQNLDSIRSYGKTRLDAQANKSVEENLKHERALCLKACSPNRYRPGLAKCKEYRAQVCEKLLMINDENIIKKACDRGSIKGCLKASELTTISPSRKIIYLKRSCNNYRGGNIDACIKLIPHYKKKNPSKAIKYAKWACRQGRESLCIF